MHTKLTAWYVPVVLQLQKISQTYNFTLQLGNKKIKVSIIILDLNIFSTEDHTHVIKYARPKFNRR